MTEKPAEIPIDVAIAQLATPTKVEEKTEDVEPM
jgi:hypothetical protein